MYLPDSVYPDLKAGGQRISLSLKKIAEFFDGKVGTNVHDSASTSSIRLSSRMVGKAYMLYVLGPFLFPTKKKIDVSVKYISFFQDQHVSKPWSWGTATLAHLYYSLGALPRVSAKRLACCTTLLESWIFKHFPKLPGIPTRNESGAPEFCTRWCWSKMTSAQTGSVALAIFREALDSYKVEDVIFDPYVEKREDKHMFEEVASFIGLLCSPEHKEPYYPDRVQRQFNRRQPVPRDPAFVEKNGLRFGDKAGPYNQISFTKLYPNVVNLGEDADYDGARVLGASSGVSQRENDEVPQNQNEGGGGPAEVVEDPTRSVLVHALEAKTSECAFLMEATRRMQADIEVKNLANSICEKKLNEKTLEYETNKKLLKDLTLECESTKKILEDQRLECESNKKLVEDLRIQLAAKVNETEILGKINDKVIDEVYVHQIEVPFPLNIVPHPEKNVGEAEMWKQKWHAKYIHETEKLGVWHLALKGAIEGWDFEDPEDPTYDELGRQFTKLLTITQEGPMGEYEDDIILSGRGKYQEMIDSRLKKIDHKTNLRPSLF
ncbi:hypothetical protein GIB67_010495 [Kingdonia uniflora]|uniref:Aminotransferase-like plant mobile domain-containing protein n=1 Tax=Kingdonia uniflora TaxID=39325 RepID=A0A7J7MAK0_9MAGN|nr:hypothetical protein GIB67_010495 [Kingdonia uniflora]